MTYTNDKHVIMARIGLWSVKESLYCKNNISHGNFYIFSNTEDTQNHRIAFVFIYKIFHKVANKHKCINNKVETIKRLNYYIEHIVEILYLLSYSFLEYKEYVKTLFERLGKLEKLLKITRNLFEHDMINRYNISDETNHNMQINGKNTYELLECSNKVIVCIKDILDENYKIRIVECMFECIHILADEMMVAYHYYIPQQYKNNFGITNNNMNQKFRIKICRDVFSKIIDACLSIKYIFHRNRDKQFIIDKLCDIDEFFKYLVRENLVEEYKDEQLE